MPHASSLQLPQPRVQDVSQRIAQHIERIHRDGQRPACGNHDPRRVHEISHFGATHHASPVSGRWRHAKADEAERCLDDDGKRDIDADDDHDDIHHFSDTPHPGK